MASVTDHSKLVNTLAAAATGLTDAMDAIGHEAGLDATSSAALVSLLDLARASSVQHLSGLIGLSHSGTVRLVDRLVRAGLIERAPGPDARTLAVTLTRRGRATAARLRARRATAVEDALAGLTDRQRGALVDICDVLVANLTAARLASRATGEPPPGGALCRLCDPTACGRPQGRCPAQRAASGDNPARRSL